jgi:Ca2+-binding EF-hand superfamily protein
MAVYEEHPMLQGVLAWDSGSDAKDGPTRHRTPKLPLEEKTARVLDDIFPIGAKFCSDEELRCRFGKEATIDRKNTKTSKKVKPEASRDIIRSGSSRDVDHSPHHRDVDGSPSGESKSGSSPNGAPKGVKRQGTSPDALGENTIVNSMNKTLSRGSRMNETLMMSPAQERSDSPGLASSLHMVPQTSASPQGGVKGGTATESKLRRATHKHVDFRQRVLDRFQTIKGAFDAFTTAIGSAGMETELSKKQFQRFMQKQMPELKDTEAAEIFAWVDFNKNGSVSMQEFHTAIECAAPVRSIEDLRRKWIALGFPSMRRALEAMYPFTDDKMSRRMTYAEFCSGLSRVGVDEDEEHACVYSTIRDPHDRRNTVSMDQLYSAMAAVSPALIVEDVREKFIKKHGDLRKAFEYIDVSGKAEGSVTSGSFMRYVADTFKCSAFEARKCFDFIDIDSNGRLTRTEFLSAFKLVEPALTNEDLRRKVRQRFRSIGQALKDQSDETETAEASQGGPGGIGSGIKRQKRRNSLLDGFFSSFGPGQALDGGDRDDEDEPENEDACKEYCSLLKTLHFSDEDSQKLFELVDIDGNGRVTPKEFTRGIRLFAPACVLEDLRLHCVLHYQGVAAAFKSLAQEQREATFDFPTLERLLNDDLGFNCNKDVFLCFQLIESRREGGLGVPELIAALSSASPGSQIPLNHEQRVARARQQVRWHLAPFSKAAKELRGALRVNVSGIGNEELIAATTGPSMQAQVEAARAEIAEENERMGGWFVAHPPVQKSYRRFAGAAHRRCEKDTAEKIKGYYIKAGSKLAQDVQWASRPNVNRAAHHHNINKHNRLLGCDAPSTWS